MTFFSKVLNFSQRTTSSNEFEVYNCSERRYKWAAAF